MARVFLTGATACVGHHVAHALALAGHQLDLLVRNPARLRPLPPGSRVSVLQGDLAGLVACHRQGPGPEPLPEH